MTKKNVDFAWTISFDEKWEIYMFSNNSWHYKPSPDDKGMFIDIMKKNYGEDLSDIYFNSVTH